MDPRRLLEELKRRRVVRAAVAYAAALFVVLQAGDIVIPAVGLPEAVMTGLVIVGLLGFPLVLALSWAFDLSSSGTRASPPEASRVEAPAGAPSRLTGTALLLLGALLVVGGSAWWAVAARGEAAADVDIRRLAVLPLANQMGDAGQSHFVDGMHDILIGELGRIEGLDVISQRSVLRYKDSDLRPSAIAAELSVQGLVEGSVFRQGDSVRVTARLVRADSETELWNRVYEGRLSEAMSLQSRVARAVADEIQLTLTPVTAEHLAREHPVDPMAMDAYLLGRELWKSRDPTRMARALEHLERAVAFDSSFALGWAGLADALIWGMAYRALDMSRDEALERAENAVSRALRLDPGLLEAHAARGGLSIMRQDYRGAERELSRVIELAPSNAQAYNWLADALSGLGRVEEALEAYARGVELDPLSALMYRDYARGLSHAGDCRAAIEAAERALELDPQHFYAIDEIARCEIRLGNEEAAVERSLAMVEAFGYEDHAADLRQAWRTGGIAAFLRQDAHAFVEFGLPVIAALRLAEAGAIAAAAGDAREAEEAVDAAFERIDDALDARDPLLFWLKSEPGFDVLRADPRWEDAVRRLESLAATQ